MIDKIEEQYKSRYKEFTAYIRKQLIKEVDHINEEDILQEVFVNLVEGINVLRPIENVVGYIYSSIRNEVSDLLRKKKRRNEYLQAYQEESFEDPQEDEELMLLLRQAVTELPGEQQEVIKQTLFEGKTFRELADETGVSINTLLARKRYAIETLREKLL